METTDVYVANFEGLYTRIEDLESTVQSVVYTVGNIDATLGEMVGYVYDIQVYTRVFLWIIGVGISFAVAWWIWKTFIKGYIRQFWRFNI